MLFECAFVDVADERFVEVTARHGAVPLHTEYTFARPTGLALAGGFRVRRAVAGAEDDRPGRFAVGYPRPLRW